MPLDVLVIGQICVDVWQEPASERRQMGGPVLYAAQAASLAGHTTGMLTQHVSGWRAPPWTPPAGPLLWAGPTRSAWPTFAQSAAPDGTRRERLQGDMPCLRLTDVPALWRQAPCLLLAPVLNECDGALATGFAGAFVGVAAQGWLRRTDAQGQVVRCVHAAFLSPPACLRAMVFSQEDVADALGNGRRLARLGKTVAVTHAARGGTVFVPGGEAMAFAAQPVAAARDSTGAGDTFAMVFCLGIWQGLPAAQAAQRAAWAAARVVEGPQMGTLRPFVLDGAADAPAT